jgi:DNA replication protein DnaC
MGIAEIDVERHREMVENLHSELMKTVVGKCELCEGKGFISETKWEEEDEVIPLLVSITCSCKKKVIEKIDFMEAGIPMEFWKADEIEPEYNVDQFKLLHAYSKRLKRAKKHGLGLLLHGENGTGKSSSASIAIIAALRADMTAAYISWPDLVQGRRRNMKSPELLGQIDDRFSRDVIVLDELGKEHSSQNNKGEICALLDSILRLRRGAFLPTIIVSNLDPPGIVDQYGESIGSLLTDRFKMLLYEPGDYRGSLGPNWDELLGGDE